MIFVFESPPHTNISGVDSCLITPSHWRYDLDRYKELGEFFFFGSIETALRLKEIGLGNIFLDDNFCYWDYSKREHAGYLLNRDYNLTSVSKINGISGHNYCNEFGLVFVRPNSFYKLFDGGIYHIEDPLFDEMDEYSVILSKPKTIGKEYRCFVVGGEVISISSYRSFGRLSEKNEDSNTYVSNFAKKFHDEYLSVIRMPGNIVIDVCELMINKTERELKIVEVNSINTSGFYLCDIKKITKAIEKEFKDKK